MQRSEAAKKAGTKEANYAVAPGRSGQSLCRPYPSRGLPRALLMYIDSGGGI
jgi:hypothetical protein